MEEHVHTEGLTWRDFNRVFFIAAAAGVMGLTQGTLVPYIRGLGIDCTFAGGYPLFH